MEMILFGVASFILVIYGLVLFRRKGESFEPVKFSQLMLIFGGALFMILALTVNAFSGSGFGQLETFSLAVTLPFALISLWKMIGSRKPFSSHGFLGLGTATMLIISTFAIPIYSQNLPDATLPIQMGLPGSSIDQSMPINLPPEVSQLLNTAFGNDRSTYNVQSNSALVAPTPATVAQTIPTLDPPVMFFISPTPTSESIVSCSAVVQTSLNLRNLPSTAAGAVIDVIEEDAVVELVATEGEYKWYYMQSESVEGWLFGEFLNMDSMCDQLSIRSWN